jgi:hypothetical protein
MSHLLLVNHFESFRGLPPHIVHGDHPGSMTWIAVKESRAPPTQTTKVISFLLHVSDQLSTGEGCHYPGLIVAHPFMPVMRRVHAYVGDVIAEPGTEVRRSWEGGPINTHL